MMIIILHGMYGTTSANGIYIKIDLTTFFLYFSVPSLAAGHCGDVIYYYCCYNSRKDLSAFM